MSDDSLYIYININALISENIKKFVSSLKIKKNPCLSSALGSTLNIQIKSKAVKKEISHKTSICFKLKEIYLENNFHIIVESLYININAVIIKNVLK